MAQHPPELSELIRQLTHAYYANPGAQFIISVLPSRLAQTNLLPEGQPSTSSLSNVAHVIAASNAVLREGTASSSSVTANRTQLLQPSMFHSTPRASYGDFSSPIPESAGFSNTSFDTEFSSDDDDAPVRDDAYWEYPPSANGDAPPVKVPGYAKWYVKSDAQDDDRRQQENFRPLRSEWQKYLLFTTECKLNVPPFSFYRTIKGVPHTCTLDINKTKKNPRPVNPQHKELCLEILAYYNVTWDPRVNIWDVVFRNQWDFPPNVHYLHTDKFYKSKTKCVAKPAEPEDWPENKLKYIYEWPAKVYDTVTTKLLTHPKKYYKTKKQKARNITDETCDYNGYEGPTIEVGQRFYNTL